MFPDIRQLQSARRTQHVKQAMQNGVTKKEYFDLVAKEKLKGISLNPEQKYDLRNRFVQMGMEPEQAQELSGVSDLKAYQSFMTQDIDPDEYALSEFDSDYSDDEEADAYQATTDHAELALSHMITLGYNPEQARKIVVEIAQKAPEKLDNILAWTDQDEMINDLSLWKQGLQEDPKVTKATPVMTIPAYRKGKKQTKFQKDIIGQADNKRLAILQDEQDENKVQPPSRRRRAKVYSQLGRPPREPGMPKATPFYMTEKGRPLQFKEWQPKAKLLEAKLQTEEKMKGLSEENITNAVELAMIRRGYTAPIRKELYEWANKEFKRRFEAIEKPQKKITEKVRREFSGAKSGVELLEELNKIKKKHVPKQRKFIGHSLYKLVKAGDITLKQAVEFLKTLDYEKKINLLPRFRALFK